MGIPRETITEDNEMTFETRLRNIERVILQQERPTNTNNITHLPSN